jgi:hypothetical protein
MSSAPGAADQSASADLFERFATLIAIGAGTTGTAAGLGDLSGFCRIAFVCADTNGRRQNRRIEYRRRIVLARIVTRLARATQFPPVGIAPLRAL